MTAWQVLYPMRRLEQMAYQHHRCFSVDREGKDLRAFRQAVHILSKTSCPLVTFPEGEVYHLNDHVKPFWDGMSMIASSATRVSGHSAACVPCALKYEYLEDPTPELLDVIARIEAKLGVYARDDVPLAKRVDVLEEQVRC